jgi:hypothetical protein
VCVLPIFRQFVRGQLYVVATAGSQRPTPTRVVDFMSDKRQCADNPQATTRPGKKPYTKPDFKFERVFETMALSCGKTNPVQAQCRFNRKKS